MIYLSSMRLTHFLYTRSFLIIRSRGSDSCTKSADPTMEFASDMKRVHTSKPKISLCMDVFTIHSD